MQAAKCADAYGLAPDNDVQTADAIQAYPQSPFDGDPTYLRLPELIRPASWSGMKDPVVRMLQTLYGHENASHIFDRFLAKQLYSIGFKKVAGWSGVYWHLQFRVLLVT